MKKIKTNFLFALLLIGVVLVAVVSASVSSESGVLSFDEEHNKTVEIKNDSNRNKRVNLELSVQDDHQVTGSVLVEVVNNDGSIALKEDLTAGDSIKDSFFFSRGGNEKIIVTPKDFEGTVRYKVFRILFY
ncbi:MAG TPA: hypothetical protein GX520_02000 [Syntrophaceticus sp.]|jgi:hypothetical protein|nr:hypothetical protein [Syntrophaceticus schinkii]MDD4261774.1 hypothetical protein [Syntrophaceticus schinkii]HHY29457.1 hypothetical protein [Syntrophaceticus sp.]